MYAVSQTYWNNVWLSARQVNIKVRFDGTVSGSESKWLNINNMKSFAISDKIMNDTKFEIGNAVMRTFNTTFFDEDGSIFAIGLGGATADVYFELNGEEVFYSRFYVNEVYKKGIQIQCECVDAMAYADVDYEPTLAYPASLYMVAQDVANCCGLTFTDTAFKNSDIEIPSAPTGATCRQMFQYIAQISGTNAKIKRSSSKDITFVGFTNTNVLVDKSAIFSLETAENPIRVTGVSYGKDYNVGFNEYVIALQNNPILDLLEETTILSVLESINDKYSSLSYYPGKATINFNAAFETGDIIKITDKAGNQRDIIISQINVTGISQMRITSSGATKEQNKYVSAGGTSAKIAEILKQVSDIEHKQIPNLSQAIVDATEQITGAISGHVYIPEPNDPYGLSTGQILIMDAATPAEATNVWRWNLNGLGFSSGGVNGVFATAMTMDGKINAAFIATGILNASIIKTGILASENNYSWIDLETGEFNLGNGALTFSGGTLNIQKEIDDINDKINEQRGYVRIDANEPSITIGATENGANVKIENDIVTLSGSDNSKATLESSKFIVEQSQTNKLYFGDTAVWTVNNGHVSLKAVN